MDFEVCREDAPFLEFRLSTDTHTRGQMGNKANPSSGGRGGYYISNIGLLLYQTHRAHSLQAGLIITGAVAYPANKDEAEHPGDAPPHSHRPPASPHHHHHRPCPHCKSSAPPPRLAPTLPASSTPEEKKMKKTCAICANMLMACPGWGGGHGVRGDTGCLIYSPAPPPPHLYCRLRRGCGVCV